MVGERDADVVVQGVLPLAGLLIGRLAASSVFFPDTSNNTAEINSNWQITPLLLDIFNEIKCSYLPFSKKVRLSSREEAIKPRP